MKKRDKKIEEEEKEKDPIKKKMREASLQEIGNQLGLTRMRICQLEKIILTKIRESRKLEEFK
jgi:DNA-directed RNA polymerase sigma subunit (sigma70/sigma32)|tara:strand:- start:7006 stop:7194 length:189 start_codon:yes stop_codon:yes gene_type:complete